MDPEQTRIHMPQVTDIHPAGTPLLTANPMSSRARVLGVLFFVFGIIYLSLFVFTMVTAGASGVAMSHQAAPAGSRLAEQSHAQTVGMSLLFGGIFSGLSAVCGALSLAAGVGLLSRLPWGRTVGIIASVALLIRFPFGTILGICALVILLGSGARDNYMRLSAQH